MGHQIEKNNDVIYANYEKPWHRLGIPVDGLFTSQDALQKADLDFEVVKKEIFRQTINIKEDLEMNFEKIPNAFETVRTDNDTHLGVVGNYYTPFQNRDAFAFMDSLAKEGEAMYDTAGALFGGRKVWMLAKLPGYVQVGKDDVEKFLLLMNSHDGTTPIQVVFTPVRVVCWNTLTAALKNGGKQNMVAKVRHTASAGDKLDEAARILGISTAFFEKAQKIYGEMAGFKLTTKTLDKYYKDIVPDPKPRMEEKEDELVPVEVNNSRAKNVRDELTNLFESSPAIKGTAAEGNLWGAFNAVTEYIQYSKPIPHESKLGHEQRFNIVVAGTNTGAFEMRQKAFDSAIDLMKN